MGSLSSRPKTPTQSQVVYIPTPVQSYVPAPSSPTSSGTGSGSAASQPTPAQTAAQTRTNSLLQRNRGVLGTVQTSFRGLLDLASGSSGRKTLLGE